MWRNDGGPGAVLIRSMWAHVGASFGRAASPPRDMQSPAGTEATAVGPGDATGTECEKAEVAKAEARGGRSGTAFRGP